MRFRDLACPVLVLVLLCQACWTAAPEAAQPAAKSVLIIGAGPAGSSLAYFLSSRSAALRDRVASVTIFEKEPRIGGRVLDTVIHDPVSGHRHVIELGASIFLEGNAILYNASRAFGLQHGRLTEPDAAARDAALHSGERAFGIFNGRSVIFSPAPFLLALQMLWRYGLSVLRGKWLGAAALKQFQKVYETQAAFDSSADLARHISWSEYLDVSGREYFRRHLVSDRFASEIIQGISRVNYAQGLDSNVLAGMAGIIPSPTLNVRSGNARIFEHMIAHSEAALHLNATVTAVRRSSSASGYVVTTAAGERTFDIVVVAAPLTAGDLRFEAPLKHPAPQLDYVHLHVTIVLGTVNPAAFRTPLSRFPKVFLTTEACEQFNSFSTLRRLPRAGDGAGAAWSGRGIFKMFSNQAVSDDALAALFDGTIEKVIRKPWFSYPYLVPRTSKDAPLAKFVVDERFDEAQGSYLGGLYFLGSFEGVMSSMESQSVSARNMANLLHSRLLEACASE